jgi:hypothetical protein
LQGGWFPTAAIPGHSSSLPSFGYDYFNMLGGLRFGRAYNFHWLLEAGPVVMHMKTSNFQSVVSPSSFSPTGLTLGNPSANVVAFPAVLTGMEVVW